MIALPPLFGAVQVTTADPLPPFADTPDGTPGTVGGLGVTALDGDEAGPAPLAFVADTVKV